MGTALLFWWTVVRCGARGRLEYGSGILYVFGAGMQCGVLGALITLSDSLWYAAYALTTTAWSMTPIDDQRLEGVLMWIPAGLLCTWPRV